MDDVFVWGKNGKTYFFYENLYWRFDENNKAIDSGYPQDLSRWNGIPWNIDAVLTSPFDGVTYFFKDEKYWAFDDYSVSVQKKLGEDVSPFWYNCEH